MKNRVGILIMVFVLLFSLPVWAGTQDKDRLQDKDQIQDQIQDQIALQDQDRLQDCDQTCLQDQDQLQDQTCLQDQDQTRLRDQDRLRIDQEDSDQARLQLRERLQISDYAKTQLQERQQLMEQIGTGVFTDALRHWAREQIASAYQWGFANGYQDGTFNPNGPISGVEGILMTSRLMNCFNNTGESINDNPELDLNEVPVWAREMIQEQTALRIASQSQVYGEEQLNRLQFAVMLAKALKLDPTPDSENDEIFLDQSKIPDEDLGYVNALWRLGIVEGSGGSFNPDDPVSRAEAVSMLIRVTKIV